MKIDTDHLHEEVVKLLIPDIGNGGERFLQPCSLTMRSNGSMSDLCFRLPLPVIRSDGPALPSSEIVGFGELKRRLQTPKRRFGKAPDGNRRAFCENENSGATM